MNKNYEHFKFRPINKYLIDSIVKSELYFSEPSQLNDPYDCQVNIKKSLLRAIEATSGNARENLTRLLKGTDGLDKWQNDIKKFGICSFSLSRKNNILKNPLMWSHYADEHKGLCLFYSFPQEFINYDQNKIIGISEVEYSDNPLTEWFIENAENFSKLNLVQFFSELGPKTLTIKSSSWEHEEEVRIVWPQKGCLKIEKSYLKQICFGLNTPDEDKILIMKIVSDSNYPVTFCEAIHGESDFGIEIKEI